MTPFFSKFNFLQTTPTPTPQSAVADYMTDHPATEDIDADVVNTTDIADDDDDDDVARSAADA
jgi:hypothetical protein